MRKSDLRSGMVVKIEGYFDGTSNGLKLVSGDFFFDMVGFELNKNFNESMVCDRFPQVKITEVYEIIDTYPLWAILKGGKGLKLIWERPREIDWSKLPRWIKVQVKDYPEEPWRNAYFIRLDDSNGDYPYKITFCDTFTLVENCICGYMQCRIHPEQEIKEEWYK
ncbi:TPA: hypothetical protein ACF2C8_002844 [Clostridium perfringens]